MFLPHRVSVGINILMIVKYPDTMAMGAVCKYLLHLRHNCQPEEDMKPSEPSVEYGDIFLLLC